MALNGTFHKNKLLLKVHKITCRHFRKRIRTGYGKNDCGLNVPETIEGIEELKKRYWSLGKIEVSACKVCKPF